MSLNFRESDDPQSRPIAIIRSGPNAGQMLWLHENPQLAGGAIGADYDPTNLINPRLYRGFNAAQMNEVHRAIRGGRVPADIAADPRLMRLYEAAGQDIVNRAGKEIKLPVGHFQPLPMNIQDQRQVLRAGGPSGVGKSYFSAEFIKAFHQMWPDRQVLLFSGKDEDKNFDNLNYMDRVDVNTLINEEGATTLPNDALRDKLVVFDDIEALQDPAKKNVYELKDRLLTTGRSYNIPMILCSHISRAGKVTQIDNNETTHELIFRSGNAMHNRKLLKDYIGLDPKQIEKILSANSRWAFIAKTCPMYCITETDAWII